MLFRSVVLAFSCIPAPNTSFFQVERDPDNNCEYFKCNSVVDIYEQAEKLCMHRAKIDGWYLIKARVIISRICFELYSLHSCFRCWMQAPNVIPDPSANPINRCIRYYLENIAYLEDDAENQRSDAFATCSLSHKLCNEVILHE